MNPPGSFNCEVDDEPLLVYLPSDLNFDNDDTDPENMEEFTTRVENPNSRRVT